MGKGLAAVPLVTQHQTSSSSTTPPPPPPPHPPPPPSSAEPLHSAAVSSELSALTRRWCGHCRSQAVVKQLMEGCGCGDRFREVVGLE